MDTLSYVTLLLAVATFILAGAAFGAIWQSYKYRKEDKTSQAVKEIQSWAQIGLNLTTRIHRLPTTHINFPPVWEVISVLSFIESEKTVILNYASLLHHKELKNTLTKTLVSIDDCLESHKSAEAMNIRMNHARICEEAFIEVLNKISNS